MSRFLRTLERGGFSGLSAVVSDLIKLQTTPDRVTTASRGMTLALGVVVYLFGANATGGAVLNDALPAVASGVAGRLGLTVPAAGLIASAVLGLLWAMLFRGGVWLRACGIAVVTADGTEASRVRACAPGGDRLELGARTGGGDVVERAPVADRRRKDRGPFVCGRPSVARSPGPGRRDVPRAQIGSVPPVPTRHVLLTDNLLLASLPPVIHLRLAPLLDPVWLSQGARLFSLGDPVDSVYFPTDALISLVGQTAQGDAVDLTTVARDGLVGLSVLLSTTTASHDAIVRVAGGALRLSAAVLRAELARHDRLCTAVLAYASRSVAELEHAIVCHRFHGVAQRFARWLLVAADRTSRHQLALTQDSLAQALGATQSAITRTALEFQDAGAIRYRYGRLIILNRTILERAACECYVRDRDDLVKRSTR